MLREQLAAALAEVQRLKGGQPAEVGSRGGKAAAAAAAALADGKENSRA